MANPQPIAVFDSGLGGLTVVKALKESLPNETIIYFGDTARVPYGNKSQALVQEYSREITEFLINKRAKMVIVACNTASSLALEDLVDRFDVPILGVIEPGAEAAVKATRNGHIGVIGTLATIRSGSYKRALKSRVKSLKVYSQPCPLFVPLVEEGWLDGEVPERVAATYLEGINAGKVDTIILGCTHYPLLKSVIRKIVNHETVLVDSAETTAVMAAKILTEMNLRNNTNQAGTLNCFVTDLPVRFEAVARRFLGTNIDHVSTIHFN